MPYLQSFRELRRVAQLEPRPKSLGDRLDDGKPQSRACLPAAQHAVEGVEHALALGGGNTKGYPVGELRRRFAMAARPVGAANKTEPI